MIGNKSEKRAKAHTIKYGTRIKTISKHVQLVLEKYRSIFDRHENMCKCVTTQSNCKFNVSLAIPTSQFSKPLKCTNIYKTNNPLFKFKHKKNSQGRYLSKAANTNL
jgi:hypothetical protein